VLKAWNFFDENLMKHRTAFAKHAILNRKDERMTERTLSQLFWNTWKNHHLELPNDPDLSFTFELTSKRIGINLISSSHSSNLCLVGVWHLRHREELLFSDFPTFPSLAAIPVPPNTIDFVTVYFQSNPIEIRGFLFIDRERSRVFVPLVSHLFVRKLVWEPVNSPKRKEFLLEIIRSSSSIEEIIQKFEDWKLSLETLSKEYERVCNCVQNTFNGLPKENRKAFGIAASKVAFKNILLGMFDLGFVLVRNYFANLSTQQFRETLHYLNTKKRIPNDLL
jgi:hypothetical protein